LTFERDHPLQLVPRNAARCAAVTLETVPPTRRIVIRAGREAAVVIGSALGVALPTTPCRSSRASERAALWLGPDEWLVLAEEGAELPTTHAAGSIVDVSHRDTTLAVSGPRAAWTINAVCALDLHLSAFPAGMCTRTMLSKAEIVLWRTAADTFRIEVARSFAPYVWACLEEARREFLA
jgi:heterotetrameric sarcosine oxidase gamma subunit